MLIDTGIQKRAICVADPHQRCGPHAGAVDEASAGNHGLPQDGDGLSCEGAVNGPPGSRSRCQRGEIPVTDSDAGTG